MAEAILTQWLKLRKQKSCNVLNCEEFTRSEHLKYSSEKLLLKAGKQEHHRQNQGILLSWETLCGCVISSAPWPVTTLVLIFLFSHTEALSCDRVEMHLQLKLQKWPIMFFKVVKRLQFVTAVWSPGRLHLAEPWSFSLSPPQAEFVYVCTQIKAMYKQLFNAF